MAKNKIQLYQLGCRVRRHETGVQTGDRLTFNIHHNEISFLTFEPLDAWKSPQTLQTKQLINKTNIQHKIKRRNSKTKKIQNNQ